MDISTDWHLLHCHFVSITRHWLPHKRLLFIIRYKNRFSNVWRTIGYILALVPWRFFFFSMPVSNVCSNPSDTQQVWFLRVRDDRYKGLCMPMPCQSCYWGGSASRTHQITDQSPFQPHAERPPSSLLCRCAHSAPPQKGRGGGVQCAPRPEPCHLSTLHTTVPTTRGCPPDCTVQHRWGFP